MVPQIVQLLTEYAQRPLGLDARRPRLSWKIAADASFRTQTAYQVLVSSSLRKLDLDEGDIWDSGRVDSDQSVHVRYGGVALRSRTTYYWKVRVWDQARTPSPWSGASWWSMGNLEPGDWQAKWIGMQAEHSEDYRPVAYLRKTFTPLGPVKRAVIYASALGLYTLYLGGRRVGSDEFAPGWTDYNVRVAYQTYDVTDHISSGCNVLGAVLASGWYCGKLAMVGKRKYGYCPYLLVQLHLEYEDGSEQCIVSDETWTTSEGPLRYSEIYRGERYDATRELDGWLEANYDAGAWRRPIELPYRAGQYGAQLVAQVEPPVRVAQEIKPVAMSGTNAGTYVFDMGQNMVGRVRLRVSGARGTQVVLDHAEVLEEDGSLHKANLRTAVPQDTYILKGEGTEELYEPSFTYHGFRYVELKGYPGKPDTDTITGIVLHTSAPITGKLETSHPGVNRLQSNIVWGQKGNFFSVPTDCPQRDERLGWTGDAQVFCRTAIFNMDAARFFAKYVTDMVDAQLDNGSFPDVAPNCGYHARKVNKMKGKEWVRPYSAGWADAGIIIPWNLYQVYGDKEVLESSYGAMVTYMGYLNGLSERFLIPEPMTRGHGDWLSLDANTPKDVLSNAYYAYSTDLMSRIAAALGKADDAQLYRERAEQIKQAFQAKFVAEDGKIKGDTQTAYAAALYMGLLSEPQAKLAARHLADDIERKGFHPTSGFLGIGYLLPALSEYGYTDVAYRLLLQQSHPSWLSQIAAGATTMWERWDGWTAERGLHPDRRMNSFNHFAFGSVGEWMYRYMAGIDVDPDRPGYKHIRIRPRPGEGMTRVHAEYESMYGTIVSSWRLEGGVFHLRVRIPTGATASVTLSDAETHEIGSGEYEFTANWGQSR